MRRAGLVASQYWEPLGAIFIAAFLPSLAAADVATPSQAPRRIDVERRSAPEQPSTVIGDLLRKQTAAIVEISRKIDELDKRVENLERTKTR